MRHALVLALLSTLVGCGYTHEELFPDDVRTVAVPIFKNRNPQLYRDVEFDLTEALVKEIELRTPYKVTPPDRADTLLEGTIVAVNQRTLSVRREGGLPQEMETRVVVDFQWRSQRDGKTLRQRRGFASVGRYIPAQPVGEFFELAQHEAVQRAARDIVSAMRKDW